MTQTDPFPTPSGSIDLPFGSPHHRPGLLVLSNALATGSIETMVGGAGFRLIDIVGLDAAMERLDRQIGCDCALLFCDGADARLERLLVQAETIAIQNQMGLVVVAPLEGVDLAFACLRDPGTQLLCAPDAADLIAALASARERRMTPTLHDFGRESESQRLQQLSEEVVRIARALDALTRGRPTTPSVAPPARISDKPSDYIGMPALPPIGAAPPEPAVTAQRVRDLIRARQLRAEMLPGDLFADPAWDMLLDLMAARLDHERVSVSSLCIASGVPPTTALRGIRTLTDKGLVVRQADPHDGRRVFIALADDTMEALVRWFNASRRYLCG
jgi:DNA-binding transcriptional ArsR family regulator